MPEYLAHSANAGGHTHALKEHLRSVSALARQYFGDRTGADEAALAGLLHDLGKYGDLFQKRLRGEAQGLDHWSQGAWVALKEHHALAAALAVEGHHVGLQVGHPDSLRRLLPQALAHHHPFRLVLSDADLVRLTKRAEGDGITFRKPPGFVLSLNRGWEKDVAAMLDVRMLFSCLVDADFLDTEAHFEGDERGKRYRKPGPALDPRMGLTALHRFVDESIRAASKAHTSVREVREALWQAAGDAVRNTPGVFTLTAPTGSGKTLAMLRFALEHADSHGLKRIVVAVPYLTIIEQTAAVYRIVFSDFPAHYVLEHHSLAGLGRESARGDAETDEHNRSERQRRLLAENWDAPIVLTTNVQLLESLFSNRPSACRKLHNLMDAVILLDEAQSLPQHLAVPTLAALSHLSAAYHSTVMFATATQPAFDALDHAVRKHAVSGWQPREAVPDRDRLFSVLKRVKVHWPAHAELCGWEELAGKLQQSEQVLVVVNLKRHAVQLLEALADQEGLFHLSTNLCPEHRLRVLDAVRARLKAGMPCRLVSTQCVEAGVDVDFPEVYRALAPLEALAQAAGRCNREGRMAQPGNVVVFEPREEDGWRRRYPTFAYFQATQVTRKMLAERGGNLDIHDPSVFREYYRQLYDLSDLESQHKDLEAAIKCRDFPRIAEKYRLIEQDAIQVLVPWQVRLDRFEELRDEMDRDGIHAGWMRRAQGLAVSVFRPQDDDPARGLLIPAKLRFSRPTRRGESDEWFLLEDPLGECYHELLGLKLPKDSRVLIA